MQLLHSLRVLWAAWQTTRYMLVLSVHNDVARICQRQGGWLDLWHAINVRRGFDQAPLVWLNLWHSIMRGRAYRNPGCLPSHRVLVECLPHNNTCVTNSTSSLGVGRSVVYLCNKSYGTSHVKQACIISGKCTTLCLKALLQLPVFARAVVSFCKTLVPTERLLVQQSFCCQQSRDGYIDRQIDERAMRASRIHLDMYVYVYFYLYLYTYPIYPSIDPSTHLCHMFLAAETCLYSNLSVLLHFSGAAANVECNNHQH